MKVILTGATGLVGSAVLQYCVAHPQITSVVVISRRLLPEKISQHHKVTVFIQEDFTHYPKEVLDAVDDAVACLWTLGLKGGPMSLSDDTLAQATLTEVEYPMCAARTFATSLTREGDRPFRFVVCSGVGAVFDEEKPEWMTRDTRRLKVDVEKDLREISLTDSSFETYMCRPTGIAPERVGWFESVPLMLTSHVKVTELAAVMAELAIVGNAEQWIWDNADIGAWGKRLLAGSAHSYCGS